MKPLLFTLLLALYVAGGLRLKAEDLSEAERDHLRQSLGEAGSSPIEFLQALEQHLALFPNSPKKPEIERALVKAAIEAKDNARIIRYGEQVLARDGDDALVLDHLTQALLAAGGRENDTKALNDARRYEQALLKLKAKLNEQDLRERAKLTERMERDLARALVYQARAAGRLGNGEQALALARKSYQEFATAEAARESAKWALAAGDATGAVRYWADAFTVADSSATEQERFDDRRRMGEAWKKDHPSEAGLGDVVLEAYDRNRALIEARRLRERERNPNAGVTDPMKLTLTSVDGAKLPLESLRGKVVVMDFWATWCAPCRAQHPLYEEVKKKFHDRADVVFLGINTDEDRQVVAPFLDQLQWSRNRVYYEDGLSEMLRVSSIPTTVIVNRKGEIVSRLNGFLPDRFVGMLSERIERTLGQ